MQASTERCLPQNLLQHLGGMLPVRYADYLLPATRVFCERSTPRRLGQDISSDFPFPNFAASRGLYPNAVSEQRRWFRSAPQRLIPPVVATQPGWTGLWTGQVNDGEYAAGGERRFERPASFGCATAATVAGIVDVTDLGAIRDGLLGRD